MIEACVPEPATDRSTAVRVVGVVARAVWWYPAAFVGAHYGTWLVAWAVLGHRPIVSIDDPKYISPIVTAPYVVTVILLAGFLPALPVGLGAIVWRGRLRGRSPLAVAAAALLFAAVWAAALMLVRWDPLRIGKWFID